MDLFVLLDTVSGTFLLPTAALAVSLYVVFAWTFDRFRDDTNVGSGSVKINAVWKPLVVFVIPVAVSKDCDMSYRSPWQNGTAERWIANCRRELLGHVVVLSVRQD